MRLYFNIFSLVLSSIMEQKVFIFMILFKLLYMLLLNRCTSSIDCLFCTFVLSNYTWDLLSNSNEWLRNNDAWENPKAVYVYDNICTVKSRALDRSTIQFWTLWAKDHSTYASNFPIINILEMFGCATNQDSLLFMTLWFFSSQ